VVGRGNGIAQTGKFTIAPAPGSVPAPDATNSIACLGSNLGTGLAAVTLR
jgi:hypothetical protein